MGLGTGVLSPGLARVVCREGIDGAFENAVDSVAESLGVTLTAEVARRATEGMGLVAEAPVQAAMARGARGQRAWAAPAVEAPPQSGVLAVEVDGLFVHRDDGWHEDEGRHGGAVGTSAGDRCRDGARARGLGGGPLWRRL